MSRVVFISFEQLIRDVAGNHELSDSDFFYFSFCCLCCSLSLFACPLDMITFADTTTSSGRGLLCIVVPSGLNLAA